ncbi:MAG: PEP-CTERM sorting domain-containing protein [Phycisphaerales bacterium]|nr:PEP-CTERM sorting domain-containing protein [Phycisphaerales bacterium]
MNATTKLAVLAGLLASTTALGGVSIGDILSLDDTRTGNEGEAGDNRYLTSNSMNSATNILLNAGFGIGTTNSFEGVSNDNWSTLYTGTVNVDFSAQEISDIQSFVSAGGGLVIQRDWGNFYPASDSLLSAFGVSVATAPIGVGGEPSNVSMSAAHPIWDGPGGSASSFLQQFSSTITGGADIIGTHDASGGGAIGVLEWGLGRVVVLTDMDAWDDFGDNISMDPGTNNAIVWENIFHYANNTIPTPGSMMLLALGGMTAARRRR